jgi:hypothetical protein
MGGSEGGFVETVLNIAAPIIAGLCILGALYLLFKGMQSRGVPQSAYGVARQEARHSMMSSFVWAFLFLILGLIIFGVYSIFGFDFLSAASQLEPEVTLTPTQALTAVPAEATIEPVNESLTTEPTNTPVILQELSTPTFTPEIPTETPTPSITPTPPMPTPTFTPDVDTAVVNSPNGLWLREAPGGTQEIELIPDGTVLVLLPGLETVDGTEWQEVRTPAGNEGWVAVDFIIYQ